MSTNAKPIYEYESELTPEHEKEFDSPLLRGFLKSYLRFRHSSPYTTKRRAFRYFEPMTPEQLSDNDNLYGEDREAAYRSLMADFKACAMAGAFDKFFENRHYHWQSESEPSLVILKSWLAPGALSESKSGRRKKRRKEKAT